MYIPILKVQFKAEMDFCMRKSKHLDFYDRLVLQCLKKLFTQLPPGGV